jgi:hypothetical protein
MNSINKVILLLVVLIIFYLINKNDNFDNIEYANVNYNTRLEDGVETVIPRIDNVCVSRKIDMNNDDVRNRYLAKDVKLNQTIPVPNNTININDMVDSNRNKYNNIDNNLYDNLMDVKSLNSMYSNEENRIEEELLTIN